MKSSFRPPASFLWFVAILCLAPACALAAAALPSASATTLTVDRETGVIKGPVSAATFKAANGLGGGEGGGSYSFTVPLLESSGVVTIRTATGSVSGALSAADWTTFNSKAGTASPTFTGTPLAPTAAVDTNTTQIATTAFVIGQNYLKTATAASTYQPLDADLTAIAALTTTSYGRATLSLADAAAGRTYFGVVIGTNVQAWSAALDTFAGNGSGYYLSRSNHTGPQAISTITGLQTALDGKFGNILVSGQNTVSGATTSGNVTFAGSGVSITTNNTTNTVTFTVTGNATGNVTNNGTLTDGAVLLGDGTSVVKKSTIMSDDGTKVTIGNVTIFANGTMTVDTVNATNFGVTNPIPGAAGGTGVDNTGKTITLGGNLTTSGAYNIVLTAGGATSVTLPTTGTLATLAGSEALTGKTYNGLTVTAGTNAYAITYGTTTANISGGYVGNVVFAGNVTTTLPEIDAKVGFRGIPWVVANANVTTNATHNGKGLIADSLGNNTTTVTLNRTQAATDAAAGGFALSIFNAATTNSITVTASSGNIILAGSGNLTGGTSAIIAPSGMVTFTLANSTLIAAGSNVTVP